MKTNLVKIAKALVLASMTLLLANCSKDSGSSATGTSLAWNYSTNTCYNTSTGQVVSGYSQANCVSTTTTGVCNGTYYFSYSGQTQTIQCNQSSSTLARTSWSPYYTGSYQTYNCSGTYLYLLVNGAYQPVTCQ